MNCAAEKLIIALDDLDARTAIAVVNKTKDYAKTFKVGLNLFCAYGPSIVKDISSLGVDIFLDLKLHDIPMQVAKAVEACLVLEPRFVTIHAAGGAKMLQEAAKAALGSTTTLLAITVLTSLSGEEYQTLGFRGSILDGVDRLTRMAFDAGVSGFVASPHEAQNLKAAFQNQCSVICPGIRSRDNASGDQARTMTATEAIHRGADAIVVGRPITKALDMVLAAQQINREIKCGMATHNEEKPRFI